MASSYTDMILIQTNILYKPKYCVFFCIHINSFTETGVCFEMTNVRLLWGTTNLKLVHDSTNINTNSISHHKYTAIQFNLESV